MHTQIVEILDENLCIWIRIYSFKYVFTWRSYNKFIKSEFNGNVCDDYEMPILANVQYFIDVTCHCKKIS